MQTIRLFVCSICKTSTTFDTCDFFPKGYLMEGVDLSGIEVWYLRELARIYMLLKFRLNSYFSRPP